MSNFGKEFVLTDSGATIISSTLWRTIKVETYQVFDLWDWTIRLSPKDDYWLCQVLKIDPNILREEIILN